MFAGRNALLLLAVVVMGIALGLYLSGIDNCCQLQ